MTTDPTPPVELAAEVEQLRTENGRMRHELEVMYGGAFDSPKSAPADRDALRDHIAEALYAHDHPTHVVPLNETGMGPAYRESADAVLAVLPPPASRADVYRQAADDLATAFGDPTAKHIGALGASYLRRRARKIDAERPELRRMADEAQPGTEAHSCPNCEGVDPGICLMNPERPTGTQSDTGAAS